MICVSNSCHPAVLFWLTSRRPALIRETVGTLVAQNKMVEDGDADEVTGLTESGGEHPIF
jgi:hypothetical protein